MSRDPIDPMTQLQEGAAQLHELYRTYVDAGFTAQQAIYLVGHLLANVVRSAPDE